MNIQLVLWLLLTFLWSLTGSALIAGTETPAGSFQATGALVNNKQVLCTGTLISKNVVLTAAHCVDDRFSGSEIPSFSLDRRLTVVGPNASLIPGIKKLPHPAFDPSIQPGHMGPAHDVGLLFLAQPITGVPLPHLPSGMSVWAPRELLSILGYGMASGPYGVKRDGSTHLRDVSPFEILLSDVNEPQGCAGDSGGPAYRVGKELEIVGVVSRGWGKFDDCGKGTIFTRIDAHLDWIKSYLVP